MPLNSKDGSFPLALCRGEGGKKKQKEKAFALALLSLKEKGKSQYSDVISYGKGQEGPG